MSNYLSLINFDAPGGRCDSTPVFADPSAFRALINDLLRPFSESKIDVVAGIDALGFVVGAAMATTLGVGFVPVRKHGKLPVPVSRVDFVDYTRDPKALELGRAALGSGTRVLLADDWVETGAQMAAAVQLVEAEGGIVAGICALNIDDNEQTSQLRSRYLCHSILKDGVA